jgi:Ni,Fe-hydrogenase III large subunit
VIVAILVTMGLALARALIGPTVYDRVLAVNMIGTKTVLLLGPCMAAKVPRVLKLPPGDYCYAVEAARGRFMVRIVSDGKEMPYRVKLRAPSFSNLSLYEEASRGMILPDALAMMGSLDLVIPDIDR